MTYIIDIYIYTLTKRDTTKDGLQPYVHCLKIHISPSQQIHDMLYVKSKFDIQFFNSGNFFGLLLCQFCDTSCVFKISV